MNTATSRPLELLKLRYFGHRTDRYLKEAKPRPVWLKEPLTDEVWRRHLHGKIRIGIVIDPERCCYGCIDIDGKVKRLFRTESITNRPQRAY